MARKTIAQLEQEIADLKRWYNELAERNKELIIDLDNARNEIARLKEQLTAQTKTERIIERSEQPTAQPESIILPNKPRRGRKPKIDTETRAYIHELRAAKDGEGKPYNSLAEIATHTGISKSMIFAILKEAKPSGRWYSVQQDGTRQYYPDYHAALRSKTPIHFDSVSNQT